MKLDLNEGNVVSSRKGLGCHTRVFIVNFQFVSVSGSFLYCETDAGEGGFRVTKEVLKYVRY